jgi:hypothetical protein
VQPAPVDDAWAVLAPPRFDGMTAARLRSMLSSGHAGWEPWAIDATLANLREDEDGLVSPWLSRERHRAIVGSMLRHQPRRLYALVRCPVLLLAAVSSEGPGARARCSPRRRPAWGGRRSSSSGAAITTCTRSTRNASPS